MKYFSGQIGGKLKTADRIALAVSIGIAAGGHDDPERSARVPSNLKSLQGTVERCLAQVDEIALQSHQNRLCFRVAEPAVEFQHLGRPVRGNHQSRIKEAEIGIAVGSQALQGGL